MACACNARSQVACRCMEEMGDWAKVLEVIDLETSDAAASGAVDDAEMQQPDDSLLFVKNDKWDGPQFLRYLPTPSIPRICIRAAVNTNLEVFPLLLKSIFCKMELASFSAAPMCLSSAVHRVCRGLKRSDASVCCTGLLCGHASSRQASVAA